MNTSVRDRWAWPLFLILAYGITWGVQIPVYLYVVPHDVIPTNEVNFLLLGSVATGQLDLGIAFAILLLCFSFGPSIAGVIVIALTSGKQGLKDLGRRLIKVQVSGKWVAFVFLFPIALSVLAVVIGTLLGGLSFPTYDFLVPLALAVPFLLFLIICTGLAEELGWRGFALPHLQKTHTAEKSSWILGIAWGLWHLPAVVMLPLMAQQATIPQAMLSILGLTIGIVGYTIVLTWFYNNTQSLFWIIILHGYANAWQSYVVLSSGNFMIQVAYGVLPWVLAVWLLKRYDTETLTHRVSSERDQPPLEAGGGPQPTTSPG